ncbi:MAG: hypothetical protein PWQ93_480 [Clostridiales bacterium]|nr:hypothetical protein [Clostridiales bacterium]
MINMEMKISMLDMIMALSAATDLISPFVSGHHKRVAYIAYNLSKQMGLPIAEQEEIVIAGALHDSGALSLEERLHTLNFEDDYPYLHAEIGYRLFKDFDHLTVSASLIRHHHDRWDIRGESTPMGSYILHLADRIDVLIDKNREVLGQIDGINSQIEPQFGHMFMPGLRDAYRALAAKESFWLDIIFKPLNDVKRRLSLLEPMPLNIDSLSDLTDIFRHIIDFRSRFTATHSAGVATVAETLSRLFGFTEQQCHMMKIAGHLHDLGKLAVPEEILEKPAELNVHEFNIMRSHTFHTYRILESVKGLEEINEWASFHHERINGKGYPFHYKGSELSLGARIMAVADVFTAITEDRPYRKAMDKSQAIKTLNYMAVDSLDGDAVSTLIFNFDKINEECRHVQSLAAEEYDDFQISSAE